GRHCASEVPRGRWDWREFHPGAATDTATPLKWGAFLRAIDEFDPLFFGISPREAELMDPQQRLLLMYGWMAFEDAGYSPRALAGSRTGIFVGTGNSGYAELTRRAGMAVEGFSSTGAVPSIGPNRLSYLLDLRGPSEPIETACSSSLVAIHRAVRSIRSGECVMALVGGINTLVTPWAHVSFNKAGMLSADGCCKPFSAEANGYVRGEGVGMLVLKPLAAAATAGDHIYATIRGSSESHGGRANSLTAPNPRSQADLIKSAYRDAGIAPSTVTYIEAHGTGTPLGDPIEINGLKMAFRELSGEAEDRKGSPQSHCGLGSVKSNIGHLELAAGVAGVLKVLLQLRNRELVPTLFCKPPNPYIDLGDSPFYVVDQCRSWPAPEDEQGRPLPRRAGVSSFGFGGVNAHVVIEEYVDDGRPAASDPVTPEHPALIVLSARNAERLREYAHRLERATHGRDYTSRDLRNLAYTLQVGREAMEARCAFAAASLEDLRGKLAQIARGEPMGAQVHIGIPRLNKEALRVLAADADLHGAPDTWIPGGKHENLLELWSRGLDFDWQQLYAPHVAGGAAPERVSLPTYPFARERYWVSAAGAADAGAAAGAEGAGRAGEVMREVLHPLVQRNTSSLRTQRFSSCFHGDEFFLSDHVIAGERMLSAAAQLEMARAAGVLAAGEEGAAADMRVWLQDVVWSRPVRVGEGLISVHIELGTQEDGRVCYEIHGAGGEGVEGYEGDAGGVIHGRGVMKMSPAAGAELQERIALEELQAGCVQRVSGAWCYQAFERLGMAYGQTHRGLVEMGLGRTAQGDRYVLGKVELPESASEGQEAYVLHPGVLDSALQAAFGMSLGDSGEALGELPAVARVPFALQELEIIERTPSRGWVHVRRAAGAAEHFSALDLDLCDDSGRLCVRMRAFASRGLDSSASGPETLLARADWIERLPAAAASAGTTFGDRPFGERRCIIAGPQFAELLTSPQAGLHAASVHILTDARGGIAERIETYGKQVLETLQEVVRTGPRSPLLLQLLLPLEADSAALAGALAGLLRSAAREIPDLRQRVIEIRPCGGAADLLRVLKAEAASPDEDDHVRHDNGRRCVE
ncbi:MAG: type I polyketide synthase, partial [Steroidobacteraceae bacterium]